MIIALSIQNKVDIRRRNLQETSETKDNSSTTEIEPNLEG